MIKMDSRKPGEEINMVNIMKLCNGAQFHSSFITSSNVDHQESPIPSVIHNGAFHNIKYIFTLKIEVKILMYTYGTQFISVIAASLVIFILMRIKTKLESDVFEKYDIFLIFYNINRF